MQKTIKLFTVLAASLIIIAGCGGGAMSGGSPKEVTLAFFERLSKKDLEGAKELATKESATTINMLKTALEMGEKYKVLDQEADKDLAEEFKDVEIGEGKITGDEAIVTVKHKKKNEDSEILLKKQDGSWKVDFSPSALSKMSNNKGENIDPEKMEKQMKAAQEMIKNMDPEKMKDAIEGMKKMADEMTPEQKEKMKEMMEKMGKKNDSI